MDTAAGDFAAYMNARERTRTADAEYNAASARLLMARVHERAAGVRSQSDPLAWMLDSLGILGIDTERRAQARELLCSLVSYVAHGREIRKVGE